MVLNGPQDIQVGRVLMITTSKMRPPLGNFNPTALARKHFYVCTARNATERNSQWLFLTSDMYRGDAGCVFKVNDKAGDATWRGTDSYFAKYNVVFVKDQDIIQFSTDDTSAVVNSVSIQTLDKPEFLFVTWYPNSPAGF